MLVSTYGFYDDGRLIVNGFYESQIDSIIYNRISWDSSARIGYYRATDKNIRLQYFEQYGGGEYINMEGIVRPDTIIIADKFRDFPWKTTVRYDTLIKSKYPFRQSAANIALAIWRGEYSFWEDYFDDHENAVKIFKSTIERLDIELDTEEYGE